MTNISFINGEYSDYEDANNAKDSFGDEYNENMLKSIETRKYEFANKDD